MFVVISCSCCLLPFPFYHHLNFLYCFVVTTSTTSFTSPLCQSSHSLTYTRGQVVSSPQECAVRAYHPHPTRKSYFFSLILLKSPVWTKMFRWVLITGFKPFNQDAMAIKISFRASITKCKLF